MCRSSALGRHASRAVSSGVHTAYGACMSTQTFPQPTPTVQMLRQVQAAPASAADGLLAATLLGAIQGEPNGSAPGQPTALAGEWLDRLLAAPALPPAFAPDLESLRWIIVKAAVADPVFFAGAPHPVRMVVDALVQSAAFIGMQGRPLDAVRAQLCEAASHINIRGQFVLDALPGLRLINAHRTQQFLEQTAQEQNLRDEGLLQSVRKYVMQEIERHTLDISLPADARAELMRAFHPLLTTLMLRYGAAAASSRWALQLLGRCVDSFTDGTSASGRRALLSALCETLRSACLPAKHMHGIAAQMGLLVTAEPPRQAAAFSVRQLPD